MNPVSLSVGAPLTPLVNLFPPEIGQKRAQRRTMIMLGIILAMFVLAILAVTVFAFLGRQVAENSRDSVVAMTGAKEEKLATYNYLPAVEAQLANSQNARKWAGITDVAWADQLDSFLATLPQGARLQSLSIAPATPVDPIVSGNSVFSTLDLGAITFSGEVAQPIDTAALQDALNDLPGFKDTTIDTLAIQDGDTIAYWSFSGSARITTKIVSGRTTTTQKIVPVEPSPKATTDGEG